MQPSKLGETSYVVGRFFGQVEPKNMRLQQLIRSCKGIDWKLLRPIPSTAPSCVRDTINAIWSMWHEYKTDRPDEVHWWLSQWFGPQKTCSPDYLRKQDRFVLPESWETFKPKRMYSENRSLKFHLSTSTVNLPFKTIETHVPPGRYGSLAKSNMRPFVGLGGALSTHVTHPSPSSPDHQ